MQMTLRGGTGPALRRNVDVVPEDSQPGHWLGRATRSRDAAPSWNRPAGEKQGKILPLRTLCWFYVSAR